MAREWKPIDFYDDWRGPDAAPEGGWALRDPSYNLKLRTALRELMG